MQQLLDNSFKDMKLQIQGLVPPGQQLHRNVLFDQLYASIPKDPEAKVQIYTAELAPKGWTNFHCHNGADILSRAARRVRGSFRGRNSDPRQSRRRIFGADREDASRPQSARDASLSLRRHLHHLAGSRSRDERDQGILILPRSRVVRGVSRQDTSDPSFWCPPGQSSSEQSSSRYTGIAGDLAKLTPGRRQLVTAQFRKVAQWGYASDLPRMRNSRISTFRPIAASCAIQVISLPDRDAAFGLRKDAGLLPIFGVFARAGGWIVLIFPHEQIFTGFVIPGGKEFPFVGSSQVGQVQVRAFWNGLWPRHGFQVNGHFICRISRRKSVFQLADFLRVLTLPLDLLARTRPSAKRRTTAMFLAPWPAR